MERRLFVIANDTVRQRAIDFLRNLPIGCRVLFQEQRRSTVQSDKMWAMIGEVSKQATLGGKHYDSESWKCIFMRALDHETTYLPTLEQDGFFPIGFRSSKLSVREMADLITLIQAWGDQNGVKFYDKPQQELAA